MTDDTDPNQLLNLLHQMEGETVTSEPGIVMKSPDWMRPWASAERAEAHGVKNPLLRRHLAKIRFRSVTSDAAGIAAWERAAQGVKQLQNELRNLAGEGVIHYDVDGEEQPSAPQIVRGD